MMDCECYHNHLSPNDGIVFCPLHVELPLPKSRFWSGRRDAILRDITEYLAAHKEKP